MGDYQANFAMPLGKRLGRPPREVAAEVIGRTDLGDFCQTPEIAGPGFINLRVRDDWIAERLMAAVHDDRLGVAPVATLRNYVVDYSAPNVAKPMHVGHIRSTVIGDSLVRVLRFLGHRVTSDNHIGDWGTQFGMILYGYKHFLDAEAYRQTPVAELSRLYRLVRQLMDYHEGRQQVEPLEGKLTVQEEELTRAREAAAAATGKQAKDVAKQVRKLEHAVAGTREDLQELKAKLAKVDNDPTLSRLAVEHASIGAAALEETARLHAGDEENLRLWREFLPLQRSGDGADLPAVGDLLRPHTLGESFYHDRLGPLVEELLAKGLARPSDGAICLFFEGIDVPMLIRKKDGAFLYGTTDLATLRYRMETFGPDAISLCGRCRQGLPLRAAFCGRPADGLTATWNSARQFRHGVGRGQPSFQDSLGRHGGTRRALGRSGAPRDRSGQGQR